MAQGTEERVAPGIDNNADVSGPHHQIAGMGVLHSSKVIGAVVEIRGGRVNIGEAGAIVDGVNQVGAVDVPTAVQMGIECGGNHRRAFAACQQRRVRR